MGALSRGRRFVARLRDAGLLDERLLFVHGSSVAEDELGMVADAGAAFSSTPDTELQMGMGFPVAWRARAAGAKASLGIDIVSNVGGDMFGQMRHALQAERAYRNLALEARGLAPNRLDVSAREVLSLATIEGARAARMDDLVGSLTPGKRADIVVLSCDRIGMNPVNDVTASVVFYAGVADVETVLVDGNVVKRGGGLVGVDAAKLRTDMERSRDGILGRARTIDRTDLRAAIMAFFPVS
jgi:cytosine/adenosine deaminase-related metal-dependent hydrolase